MKILNRIIDGKKYGYTYGEFEDRHFVIEADQIIDVFVFEEFKKTGHKLEFKIHNLNYPNVENQIETWASKKHKTIKIMFLSNIGELLSTHFFTIKRINNIEYYKDYITLEVSY